MNTVWNKQSESGVSLAEMVVVLLVISTMAMMSIPMMTSAIRQSDADAAAQLVSQQVSYARSVALSTRQPVLVQFIPEDRSITVAPGTGSQRGPLALPGLMDFVTSAIQPATQDNVGATVLGGGENLQVWFADNGSMIDDPVANNILSGTIFLRNQNGDEATGRAITVLGGTGRVHIWRYDTNNDNWK